MSFFLRSYNYRRIEKEEEEEPEREEEMLVLFAVFLHNELLSKCLYCRFLFLLICTSFPPRAFCACECFMAPKPRSSLVSE